MRVSIHACVLVIDIVVLHQRSVMIFLGSRVVLVGIHVGLLRLAAAAGCRYSCFFCHRASIGLCRTPYNLLLVS